MLVVYVTTATPKAPFKAPWGWELDPTATEQNDYGHTVWRYEIRGIKKRDVRLFLTFAYATELILSYHLI